MNNAFSYVEDKYQMGELFIQTMSKFHENITDTYDWILSEYLGIEEGDFPETTIIRVITDDFDDFEYPRIVYASAEGSNNVFDSVYVGDIK